MQVEWFCGEKVALLVNCVECSIQNNFSNQTHSKFFYCWAVLPDRFDFDEVSSRQHQAQHADKIVKRHQSERFSVNLVLDDFGRYLML